MIVVDTNVVAYSLINGEHTRDAEAVRRRDRDWRVPGLFLYEWINVVARHVNDEFFTRDQALRIYRKGLAMVRVEESPPDPVRIINLSLASGCSSYDCQFVAVAEKLRARFVTADKKIIRSFPNIVVSIKNF